MKTKLNLWQMFWAILAGTYLMIAISFVLIVLPTESQVAYGWAHLLIGIGLAIGGIYFCQKNKIGLRKLLKLLWNIFDSFASFIRTKKIEEKEGITTPEYCLRLICPKCGCVYSYTDKQKFCLKCGERVVEDSTTFRGQAGLKEGYTVLMPCPDCKKEISREALQCPNCGKPNIRVMVQRDAQVRAQKSNSYRGVACVMVLFGIILAVISGPLGGIVIVVGVVFFLISFFV